MLFSFDHAKCDAILQARNIEVVNAYEPGKAPGWRDYVYFGFWWVLVWETLVVAAAIWEWKHPRSTPRSGWNRIALTAFSVFGLFFMYLQLSAMVKYVDTCTSLMH